VKPEYLTAIVFFAVYAAILFLLDLQLEALAGAGVCVTPYAWRIVTQSRLRADYTFGANQENAFIYFRF